MVYRIYVEKKPGFDGEAQARCCDELVDLLGIQTLSGLRLFNRYDVEGIDDVAVRSRRCPLCSASRQLDDDLRAPCPTAAAPCLPWSTCPASSTSARTPPAQCIQLLSQGERPAVRTARVYLLDGELTDEDVAAIKQYVINPVEAREASLEERGTLQDGLCHPAPTVETLTGFTGPGRGGALEAFRNEYGLAMDQADIAFCQDYFRVRAPRPHHHRDPPDRHLLVRPLPPHHLRHHHRRRGDR